VGEVLGGCVYSHNNVHNISSLLGIVHQLQNGVSMEGLELRSKFWWGALVMPMVGST
jgi:hypothetical protein